MLANVFWSVTTPFPHRNEESSLRDSYERLLDEYLDSIAPIVAEQKYIVEYPFPTRLHRRPPPPPNSDQFKNGKRPSRGHTMDMPVIASNALLREDLAIQMIHENRVAIERCKAVAAPGKAPEWCMK